MKALHSKYGTDMTSRLRSIATWVALPLLGLGAVVALVVLPALRADARREVFAEVSALRERGEPLSRAELLPLVDEDLEAARALTELSRDDRFDPLYWEPPAEVVIDPLDLAELVYTRVLEEPLIEEERIALARWIADREPDLELVRSLLGKPLGDFEEAGSKTPWLSSLPRLSRIFAAEAILAAHEGDVDGVARSVADGFALARINDRHPLAITFLAWVYLRSLTLATLRRAAEVLPPGSDLAPIAALFDATEIEERLRLAYRGERVLYLESLGLVRNGRPTPEGEIELGRPSRWAPAPWLPTAEWSVLDDLRVLEHLIEGGLAVTELPLPERTSGMMRSIVRMDLVGSARAHASEIEELRERLRR